MNECLLCKRDMKVSKGVLGNSCIRNIYSFLELTMPKKVKNREDNLYKNIMRMTNTKNINQKQKVWLTDRYLTYQYVNKMSYGNYDKLKLEITNDIKNIKNIKDEKQVVSTKKMSLKQAYDIYKKMMKFQRGIDKLKKGNFTDEESLKVLITSFSFAFNIGKNKSQYEKSTFKAMQYVFWQTVIEFGGKYAGFSALAEFLQHSLEKNPKDLFITKGNIIQEIMDDNYFKNNMNNIVKKYGENCEEFIFDSTINAEFPMRFEDKDLYFVIHSSDLYVSGKKVNGKWNLDVILHDKYDYSQPKKIMQYYNDTSNIAKSLLSSTLYNFASFSVKNKVMKEYNIEIKFCITEFEVN